MKNQFTDPRKIARLYTSGLRSYWDRRHAQCWRCARHNVNLSYFCVAAFVTLNKRLFWWKEMLAFNKVVIKFGHVSKVSSLQVTAEQVQQFTQHYVLAPALQSGLWIATLLLIGFAFLLQNIYKFAKITWLFKVKYCLADCFRQKGYIPLGGKMFAKRSAYEENIFGGKLLADLGGAHHLHPLYGKNPPKSIRPLPQSIKIKSTNKLRLYIILVHLFLWKYL